MNSGRFIRLREVVKLTGLSRATVYRRMADGTFPAHFHIGRSMVAWHGDEIDAWMRNPTGWQKAA